MALLRIGEQQWDFVDATARELSLPPAGEPAVELPARWRLFGPLEASTTQLAQRFPGHTARSLMELTAEQLRKVPDELTVSGRTLEGREVVLTDGALDLHNLFGGHQMGQQAFLFSELDLAREEEVAFGAGCDWWMQWWIDGQIVCDTMEGGNRLSPPTSTDHCFRCRLAPGKHLLAIRLISGLVSWTFRAAVVSARQAVQSELDELEPSAPRQWTFVHELEEIHPPRKDVIHTMAIVVDRCLADETIECEFQRRAPGGNLGIVFGAQDTGHYYWAQIPWHGQLPRARGFWAAISKADGSGYIRNLALQLMPNVPAFAYNDWLSLRVQRLGERIQMWVNSVRGPCVTDSTYGPGRVGIAGFSLYRARRLRINGKPVPAGPWPTEDRRAQPWFLIEPDPSLGDIQAGVALCKMADDEIHLAILIGCDTSVHNPEANWRYYRYLSTDRGRTWSRRGIASQAFVDLARKGAHWFKASDGLQRMLLLDASAKGMSCWDSTDGGESWSGPTTCKLLGDWSREMFREGTRTYLNSLAELADGTLLAMLNVYGDTFKHIPGDTLMTWGAAHGESWCSRSEDRGLNWSEPVPTDYAADRPGEPPGHPNIGFSENFAAQLPGGRIVCLSRPHAAPFMWQTHSDDGGQSWSMACYAPFTGAGYPNVVATRSGYLTVVKRAPGLALNYSLDGGLNWDAGTQIDFPGIFNGRAIEVEPDMLLVVYPETMDEVRPGFVRAQLIRMTPQGPTPVPVR